MYGGITTWRDYLSFRRVIVTLGVAGTMGVVEWLGLGHIVGLIFGVLMGLLALLVAPLPWLWILPWGLRRPPLVVLARAAAVVALSAAFVVAAYLAFFALRDQLVPRPRPLVAHAMAHLSAWSSVVISIPLFSAAGWGLSRHVELERRLEVHDAHALALRSALEEARLLALQSRLDPHFLFNALNLVAELCQEDPAEAERCVLRLSGLLRAALEHSRQSPLISLARLSASPTTSAGWSSSRGRRHASPPSRRRTPRSCSPSAAASASCCATGSPPIPRRRARCPSPTRSRSRSSTWRASRRIWCCSAKSTRSGCARCSSPG